LNKPKSPVEVFKLNSGLLRSEWINALQPRLQPAFERIQETLLGGMLNRIEDITFDAKRMHVVNGVLVFKGEHASTASRDAASALASDLIPWRKGPFKLGDLEIDAEWRSDLKWSRLIADLPDLKGKRIADVGCNNGYYLYRCLDAGAESVIGFDPTIKYWLQFEFVRAHAPELPVAFLPVGSDSLDIFHEEFDMIFLMGINYHDADPDTLLHLCKSALKPGGLLICESVVIPGTQDLEIFPQGRYAGIGGVYGIPSVSSLQRQLRFAGFNDITLQHCTEMTETEQRQTHYSPQKSFSDYMANQTQTIEGYPRPQRAAFFAKK
jgi:tRNA (mo5U34)-methyltransferase